MIARCPVCRGFVEVARVPHHPERIGMHPDARSLRAVPGVAWWRLDDPLTSIGPGGAPLCQGSGTPSEPLLVYLAHPVAPPFVNSAALGAEWKRGALDDEHVRRNLISADQWYAWALAAIPHHSIAMPWRPLLDALREDGGAGRARGLRIAKAMAGRFDVVLAVGGRKSSGMADEGRACEGGGGFLADLTYLGPCPPAAVKLPELLAD